MVRDALRLDGDTLVVQMVDGPRSWNLASFDRILVLGFGKAGARMALGAQDALGDRITGGLVAVKKGHAEPCERIEIIEAAHPIPDATSVTAACRILELAREADERTLVLVLVSGGGSAILCAPRNDGERPLTLSDKAAVTCELLASGAEIHEINAVRRHLSAVKGGALAAALAPAAVVSLILSDVVGDELSSIASGPTVPDPSTWADALAIVRRFGILDRIPPNVSALLVDGVAGRVQDTPKPGDPAFSRVANLVIGSNRLAALTAVSKARELGYETLYLGSRVTGEAREIARFYLGMALDCAANNSPMRVPACLVAGGETTVTIKGDGLGGRNQEMALAFLVGLSESNVELAKRITFLSAGTDGNDGPTDAAGAFADLGLLEAARRADLSPRGYLARNDSYRLFDATSGLLRTGPTNTNVCDLQILLVV